MSTGEDMADMCDGGDPGQLVEAEVDLESSLFLYAFGSSFCFNSVG